MRDAESLKKDEKSTAGHLNATQSPITMALMDEAVVIRIKVYRSAKAVISRWAAGRDFGVPEMTEEVMPGICGRIRGGVSLPTPGA